MFVRPCLVQLLPSPLVTPTLRVEVEQRLARAGFQLILPVASPYPSCPALFSDEPSTMILLESPRVRYGRVIFLAQPNELEHALEACYKAREESIPRGAAPSPASQEAESRRTPTRY